MKRHTFLIAVASSLLLSLLTLFSCSRQPLGDNPAEFSFVLISDVHIPSYGSPVNIALDDASLEKAFNTVRLAKFVKECTGLDPKPSFVMNCGDTGDSGWTELLNMYVKTMRPLVKAGIPVFTVVGNHDLDYAGLAAQDLGEIFDPIGPTLIGRSGPRYSFDYGGCHFIVLNDRPVTGLIRFNPEELAWFEADLTSVNTNTRVLVFLHADLPDDDTQRLVEILQPFPRAVIFQGHQHSSELARWGSIPVVLTGSTYGGEPKAGSYRLVTVTPDSIMVATRDFADSTEVTLGPWETVRFSPPAPRLRLIEPAGPVTAGPEVAIAAETIPASDGVVECRILGAGDWMPMTRAGNTWAAALPTPAMGGNWLVTARYTGQTGEVSFAHTTVAVPDSSVQVLWRQDLRAGIMGAPAIWENLAIVPAGESGVHALDLETGKPVWHRPIETGQALSRVVVHDGIAVYGAGRTVFGCDAATGTDRWTRNVEGSVIAGVTLSDGRIFVPSGEHKLFCLDAATGSVEWEYDVPRPIMMQADAAGGKVVFGAMDGIIRALDAATGAEAWTWAMSKPEDQYVTAAFWPPVIAGNTVVAGKIPASRDEKNLAALNLADGSPIWSIRLGGGVYRPLASSDGTGVFVSCQDDKGDGVQRLSAADGSPVWTRTGCAFMLAAATDGASLVVRDSFTTSCLDAATGDLHWTLRTSTGQQGAYYGPHAMAVRGNTAIIGTLDGVVLALRW